MLDILIFFLFFYLLLISVIGFGFLFQNIFFKKIKNLDDQKIIYTGFYGLFSLTFISTFSSFFFSHNFIHNLLQLCLVEKTTKQSCPKNVQNGQVF